MFPVADFLYCSIYDSPRLGREVILFPDFEDRTGRTYTYIEIHNGNIADDSEGCILVGETRGTINGNPAVLNSNAVLDDIIEVCRGYNILVKVRGGD